MRSLIILLSLVVFFLTGLIIGIDRSNQENAGYQSVDEVAEPEEQQIIVEKTMSDSNTSNEEVNSPEAPEHFTHKAASFLESSVKGFYELIVGAAYQLVEVFF